MAGSRIAGLPPHGVLKVAMRVFKLRESNREAAKNAKKTYLNLRTLRSFVVKIRCWWTLRTP
jgi:hypothetical protein